MVASPQAMATCTNVGVNPGTVVRCDPDVDNVLPTITFPSISIINSAVVTTVAGETANQQIGVRLLPSTGENTTSLTNSTSITSQVTDIVGPPNRNAYTVFGVVSSGLDDTQYAITNSGNISALHNGIGATAGIGFLGDNEELSVDNTGTISVTRGTITLSTNTGASLTAIAGANAAATLGNASAIWVQEEENKSLEVDNDGTISATGKLTSGILTRGAFLSVENDSIISASGVGSVAIAANNGTDNEDDNTNKVHNYFIGNTVIVNTGSILGDTASQGAAAIQIGEPNSLRWQASRVNEGGGPYDPLTITSQAGRRDSTIVNSGIITGNIYLGAGNHVLTNTEGGQITGSIDVDQRRSLTYTVGAIPAGFALSVFRAGESGGDDDDDEGGLPERTFTSLAGFLAALPDHHFEFDNAAPLIGNVTVHTYNGAAVNNSASTILLEPHVTGSGIGSAFNAPSLNSGYISGTLAIGNDGANGQNITVSTIATTTTLTPKIDSVVHSGEWFLVAQTLFGNALPMLSEDSVLVDWTVAKNGNNSLVIGSTVKNASIITGLSQPGIDTINNLLSTDGNNPAVNALAAGVQSLTSGEDVRKAGEQLAPQTNFATQQVAITMAFLTGQYIDDRLLGVGATAPSGTAFAPPSGLGASNIASNFAPPPYALGMGSGDGRMNAGANDDTFYYDVGGYDPKWNNYGLWGQAFGAGLSQNQIANVDGYNANLYGALIGMDNWVNPALRVGFAGGWGHTGINGTGDTTRNETDINSYMGFAYGAVKGYGWYMSGRAGFAWHNYDASRVLNAGGLNQVANGSHDGRQYIGALELGTPFGYGMTTITPVVSVNYTHLNQDGYKEQGGGMALTYADQETDSLQSGLGLKAVAKVASSTLIEGRALWFHEFDDAEQQVTAAFAGTPSFTTAGPGVGRDTADLGVGILAYTSTGTSFQINYDALLRQDFTGHTGTAKLKFDF